MPSFRQSHESRRTLLAGSVATIVHAALIFVGVRCVLPTTVVAHEALPNDALEGIEITLLSLTSSTVMVARYEKTATLASSSSTGSGSGAATPASKPRAEASATAPIEPGSIDPATAPSAPVMLFVPDPGAIGIAGSGAPNPFLARGVSNEAATRSAAPEAPTADDAKRAVDRSLASARQERDGAIGLGPEGPVLASLEAATHAGFAPEHGNATFLAVIDAHGIVVDLRLLSSRGGEHGWLDARQRAARALMGKTISLRGAVGAELTIAVDSDVRTPSGGQPARPVSPAFSPSRIVRPENAPDGTPDVVHSYTLGRFDLSDVKAKPVRIVHARLVSLSLL